MLLDRTRIRRRIVEIAFKRRLSHLSSCLTTAGILCDIYECCREDEPVVLSNGHAGLALYVVLEAVYGLDAEDIERRHGVHPKRSAADHIWVSTGSLGMGLPIALGMAFGDRSRRVFSVISDGECAEGSVWEALSIKTKYRIDNLHIFVNINGFSAYDSVDSKRLGSKLQAFDRSVKLYSTGLSLPFAPGYAAHYHVLAPDEYRWLMEHLEEVTRG